MLSTALPPSNSSNGTDGLVIAALGAVPHIINEILAKARHPLRSLELLRRIPQLNVPLVSHVLQEVGAMPLINKLKNHKEDVATEAKKFFSAASISNLLLRDGKSEPFVENDAKTTLEAFERAVAVSTDAESEDSLSSNIRRKSTRESSKLGRAKKR